MFPWYTWYVPKTAATLGITAVSVRIELPTVGGFGYSSLIPSPGAAARESGRSWNDDRPDALVSGLALMLAGNAKPLTKASLCVET